METERENTAATREIAQKAHSRNHMGKIKGFLIKTAVILLAVLAAVGITWSKAHKRGMEKSEAQIAELKETIRAQEEEIENLINNPIVVNPVAPTISLDVVTTEIQEIGELATVEYLYTNAGVYSDAKKIFKKYDIPLTQKTFTMKWDGCIKAGIDIEKVTAALNEETNVLTISLPQARILSHDPDRESVEVYNEHDGLFNKVTVEDQVSFDIATEGEMEERAIENGLLDKAQKNAEQVILNLLNTNPDIRKYYTIEFVQLKK